MPWEGFCYPPKCRFWHFSDRLLGIVFHVYLNPAYRAFGPEMNRNMVQSRCERIGAERFMLELDHWWRDFARKKLHQAPQ